MTQWILGLVASYNNKMLQNHQIVIKSIKHLKKRPQIITILDFWTGKIYIKKIPKICEFDHPEDIMHYFETKLPIHAEDCNWMVSCDPKIHIDKKIIKEYLKKH